jgi:hypothetical protein
MKKLLTVILIILFSTSLYAKKTTRRYYKVKEEKKEETPIVEKRAEKKEDYKDEKQGISFDFELYGLVYGVLGAQSDYHYDGSHIRLRPGFIMANKDMKAVFMLEIDQNFGRGDTIKDADPGTDNFAIEVKHAYLETSKKLLNGLIIQAGLNSYSFPVVVDNDFAVVNASYDLGIIKPVLSVLVIEEYSEIEETATGVEQDSDLRVYAVDIPLKYGGFSIRPLGMHIVGGGSSAAASKGRITLLACNIIGDVGFAVLNATGAYMLGDLQEGVGTSAYAADADLEIKINKGLKLGGFFTLGSGDDDILDTDENNAFFYNMNNIFGDIITKTGAPDGRLLLLENATVANSLTGMPASKFDYMDDQLGYMSYGGYIEAAFGNVKALAQFGMAFLIEEDDNGNNAIGSEIDLKLSYGIVASTSVFVEGAYIIASDVLDKNVYQAAFGMTTKF